VGKKAAHGVRARYVAAPATPGVIAPTHERKKEKPSVVCVGTGREGEGERERRKRLDNGDNLD
jgi:co-chaperonin GroES (HSP10)